MNTVPFDYELFEKGYKAVTRSGEMVNDYHLFNGIPNYPLRCEISGEIRSYSIKGAFFNEGNESRDLFMSPYDLFMIPPTVERFINIYAASDYSFESLQEAKTFSGSPYAGQAKITFQNGKPISIELIP